MLKLQKCIWAKCGRLHNPSFFIFSPMPASKRCTHPYPKLYPQYIFLGKTQGFSLYFCYDFKFCNVFLKNKKNQHYYNAGYLTLYKLIFNTFELRTVIKPYRIFQHSLLYPLMVLYHSLIYLLYIN